MQKTVLCPCSFPLIRVKKQTAVMPRMVRYAHTEGCGLRGNQPVDVAGGAEYNVLSKPWS